MVGRETVTFESRGVRCVGDLYTPEGDPPRPAVVMAHGFGAERSWGLPPYAERFARAGIAAFVFDHRHLGDSGGRPRRLVAPRRQLADWAAALDHVAAIDRVDEDRLAVWGTSLSGGHVLATARREHGLRAVVAQVPFVDGPATTLATIRRKGFGEGLRQLGLTLADRAASAVGRGPVEVPIVSRPGEGAIMDTPGALEGYRALVPEDEAFVNRTPARVVSNLAFYRPGRGVGEIDAPVHVTVAGEDRILPVEATEEVVDRLDEATVERVPVGHFGVYQEPWFDRVVEQQEAFLTRVLDADA